MWVDLLSSVVLDLDESLHVTELWFCCSSLKNPILRDKYWVKGKIALLRKLELAMEEDDRVFQLLVETYSASFQKRSYIQLPFLYEKVIFSNDHVRISINHF